MPRILDLFCGAGGAAAGYHRAGFDVVGVDINPQPNYPFRFHQADALIVLRDLILGDVLGNPVALDGIDYRLTDFAAAHSSPPCQRYTTLQAVARNSDNWPDLVDTTRELLNETGLPYVIENVQGSPVRRDVVLCGEMFRLGVIRHRYFELGKWTATSPAHVKHRGRVRGWRHGVYFDGPYVAPYGEGGGKGSVLEWQQALGITWTDDRRELAEAIPPAYTEWVGAQLINQMAVSS
jgi:hypothetical protein